MGTARAAAGHLLTGQGVDSFCPLVPNLIGKGNGTPLQYSCLENPMDGGSWTAGRLFTV